MQNIPIVAKITEGTDKYDKYLYESMELKIITGNIKSNIYVELP